MIMGNLFCSEYTIHRRFDLKGSSLGRITIKPESEISETTILKDLDLNFIFRLQKSWFQEFCRWWNTSVHYVVFELLFSLLIWIVLLPLQNINTPTMYICYLRQIDRDCELLEQEGIMDYSLLVGIHFKDISENGDLISSRSHTLAGTFLILILLFIIEN